MAVLNAHQYMSQNGKWKDFLKNKTNQQNILLKESQKEDLQRKVRRENLKTHANYLELIITGKALFVR